MADEQPIIWMRPEKPARGPAPAYSRRQITEVAIRLADAEGLDGLTMRKLAAELGSGTMSLYRYVPSRDDLLDLMLDAVYGEMLPEGYEASGDWRKDLTTLAGQSRQVLRRHPWAISLAQGMSIGPNSLELVETMLTTVAGLGMSIDRMMMTIGLVGEYVKGFVREELRVDATRRSTGLSDDEQRTRLAPYILAKIATGRYPLLERVIRDAEQPHMDMDDRFAYGLGFILDGVPGGRSEPP